MALGHRSPRAAIHDGRPEAARASVGERRQSRSPDAAPQNRPRACPPQQPGRSHPARRFLPRSQCVPDPPNSPAHAAPPNLAVFDSADWWVRAWPLVVCINLGNGAIGPSRTQPESIRGNTWATQRAETRRDRAPVGLASPACPRGQQVGNTTSRDKPRRQGRNRVSCRYLGSGETRGDALRFLWIR
jgi:hypothetical protein